MFSLPQSLLLLLFSILMIASMNYQKMSVNGNPIDTTSYDDIVSVDDKMLIRIADNIMDSINYNDDDDDEDVGEEEEDDVVEIGGNNEDEDIDKGNNNLNSNGTTAAVLLIPKERCLQPVRKGVCRALIPRWNYDPKQKICSEFKFGGCDGNGNNFKSYKQCMDICKGL